jgi:hypothetical protein
LATAAPHRRVSGGSRLVPESKITVLAYEYGAKRDWLAEEVEIASNNDKALTKHEV